MSFYFIILYKWRVWLGLQHTNNHMLYFPAMRLYNWNPEIQQKVSDWKSYAVVLSVYSASFSCNRAPLFHTSHWHCLSPQIFSGNERSLFSFFSYLDAPLTVINAKYKPKEATFDIFRGKTFHFHSWWPFCRPVSKFFWVFCNT